MNPRKRRGPVLLNLWLHRFYDKEKAYYIDNSAGKMSRNLPLVYSPRTSMSRSIVNHKMLAQNPCFIFLPRNAILNSELGWGDEWMSRNDICFCGSGKKLEKCHANMAENSAVFSLWERYAALDTQITSLKQDGNVDFICKEGCNYCCADYFYISQLEYYAIKHHYLTFFPSEFEQIKDTAKDQMELLRNVFPEEYQRFQSKVPNVVSMFQDDLIVKEQFQPCPCLDQKTGSCRVYAARPIICRLHGVSSALPMCAKIRKYLKGPLGLFPRNPQKHLLPIAYGDDLIDNIDRFGRGVQQVISRPFPLFYWLSTDDDHENIYQIACTRQLDYYFSSLNNQLL